MTTNSVTADVRTFIHTPRETVFDYFVDLRNEPEYNRQVRKIVKTSEGPIGANTTFEGLHKGFGRVSWRLAEYVRPTHVVIEGAVGDGVYRWTSDFEAADDGTWLNGQLEWEPSSFWMRFRSAFRLVLRWNARRSFRRFAKVLETRERARTS